MFWARTTGVAASIPLVRDVPVSLSRPLSEFRVRTEVYWRIWVDAATVVTHGAKCPVVPAPGPSLPADVATKTPALYASRKAISAGSVYGSVPPEMEKLMTLAPSRIACWTAAAESDA